jgi:hypothetical protein
MAREKPRTTRQKPQAQALEKHPEPYQHELNPETMVGQNIGLGETQPAKTAPTAYDVKAVHRRLHAFSDDELKLIRLLPAGTRLEQGATYLDLAHVERGAFTATGDMQVGPASWMVAKKEVPYELWNQLLGIETPGRVGKRRD